MHIARGDGMNGLHFLNWPVALASFSALPFLNWMWERVPAPTAIYMAVSALFMLFQMADKMGLLERFKRKSRGAK